VKQWDLKGITTEASVVTTPPLRTVVPPADDQRIGPASPGARSDGRAVIDQVPAVLWTTDIELSFTACLGAGLASLGLWPNQVVGTSLYEFFETDDEDEEAIAIHRAALDGDVVAGTLLWGGHEFHVRVGPLCDATGAVIGTVGMGFELLGESLPHVTAPARSRWADAVRT
jgi:PAS domain-containing protein